LLSQDNANLFWDASSKTLNLGTNTPGRRLTVQTPSGSSQAASFQNSDYVFNSSGTNLQVSFSASSGATTPRLQGWSAGENTPADIVMQPNGGALQSSRFVPTSNVVPAVAGLYLPSSGTPGIYSTGTGGFTLINSSQTQSAIQFNNSTSNNEFIAATGAALQFYTGGVLRANIPATGGFNVGATVSVIAGTSFRSIGVGAYYCSNLLLPNFVMNDTGSGYGFIQNDVVNTWSLAYGGSPTALGTPALVWNTAGKLLASATTTEVTLGSSNKLQIQGTTAASNSLGISAWSANTLGSRIELGKSRGAAVGTNTIVQSGDVVGSITGYGANGTAFDPCAQISMEIDATPGASTDMPGRIVFKTTPDGSVTLTTALTIDNKQAVKAATTLNTGGYTVGTLPTGVTGAMAYVTDALAPTFLATIVGGGAITTPVFYNGTNWVGA
jgi:hypothetical protein